MAKRVIKWTSRPGETELAGASRYLSLQFPSALARRLVTKARRARKEEHVAKDLLRASRLPLLPTDERHVADNLKKIRKGKSLTPVIVVQGDWMTGRPLIIADGYHRMCAACHADEDALISLVMVSP
jgi:hypothetical protein